ncbi:MAG: DUF2304 domain-containing protein [Candidatus Sericytochromatia bacterium]
MDVQLVRIQVISIIGSLALLAFIVDLLRKRRLREEYSILWLLGGVCFLVLAVFRDLLTQVSFAVGVAYPPAALFLMLIMGAYLMLLHFSMVFSRLADKTKLMAQEIALLRLELDRVRAEREPGPVGER